MLLDDSIPDSYRASMDIRERKVDPRYLEKSICELKFELGYAWIAEQDKIFGEIYQEGR